MGPLLLSVSLQQMSTFRRKPIIEEIIGNEISLICVRDGIGSTEYEHTMAD